MPLHIVRNDITRMDTDAIVNAAKNSLLGGGGVDGAIHRAAGPGLLEECRTLGGCATGQAKITKGYNLDAKYVIHTVGPVWQGGNAGERELLQSCYTQSLNLAKEYRCKTVAFPLISTGVYGYPKDLAITAAVDAIGRWLAKNDMTVYLVIFDNESHLTGKKLYRDIKSYIDDNYAERHSDTAKEKRRRRAYESVLIDYSEDLYDYRRNAPLLSEDELYAPYATPVLKSTVSLEEYIKQLDEGFSGTLLSLIEEKGMTHSQCYKKANISRKHFSKIRNNPGYHPAKTTVLAFAIALELSLEQTEELLKKAGYALSHADVGDLIIEFFIKNGNYDIFKLNNALYDFDQPLLGL